MKKATPRRTALRKGGDLVVLKLGGELLEDPERMAGVAKLIARASARSTLVVVLAGIQDPGNYYAAKLRRNPSGQARVSFIRWKVVNGVPGPEAILPLEMRLPSNDQYTVKVDVRGDQIVTTLQGKVIDRWTDDTFTKGGFAYANQNTERGEIVTTTIGMVKGVPAR